jgi:hypothetical protein
MRRHHSNLDTPGVEEGVPVNKQCAGALAHSHAVWVSASTDARRQRGRADVDGDAAEFCTNRLTFVGMNSILWRHAVLLARVYWIPGVPLTGSIPAAIHASRPAGPESAWTNDPAGPGAAVREVIAAPNTM